MTRFIEISTPLGAGTFDVQRMTGREELGRLSEYQVDLLSEKPDIAVKDILGKNVTLVVGADSDQPRYYNGYVTQLTRLGEVSTPAYKSGRGFAYQMRVHPWLWFLTRTSTCKIYQAKKVPEVVKDVLERYKFTELKQLAGGTYSTWEYCVQYRETDFNFISRLLEQEGLYYFFEHENGKHRMLLLDGNDQHTTRDGAAEFLFNPDGAGVANDEVVTAWDVTNEIQPGAYALGDFNFETSKVDLSVVKELKGSHDLDGLEIFDYPGEYEKKGDGEQYANVRIQELATQHETVRGGGNTRRLEVGRLFKLKGHPDSGMNQEYLVTSCNFMATNNLTESGGGGGTDYTCSFTAIPKTRQYRPGRITPKPIVQGVQTAIVVGPSGEEIHTDKYGRVKVQFHWDRYAKGDENSSCWVRVSNPWAGKQWGMVALPRIGQEVIIDFIEGDPDWPIITGRAYNDDMMPPYALPDNKTRTGIITSSTPNGGPDNFNELRFEDKKGSEQVFMHAEKDLEFRTKHDRVEWVGNESHLIVTKDTFEKLDADYHLTLKGDHNEKLDGSLSFKVGQDTHVKSGQKIAMDTGQEIHLKGGMKVIIEGGTQVSLKVGGSFINISPAGVDISGPMVKINSGGSAGSGSGASPIAPKAPREADKGKGGEKGEPPKPKRPPKPNTFSPQASVFQEAANSGAPFCAECAAAAAAGS